MKAGIFKSRLGLVLLAGLFLLGCPEEPDNENFVVNQWDGDEDGDGEPGDGESGDGEPGDGDGDPGDSEPDPGDSEPGDGDSEPDPQPQPHPCGPVINLGQLSEGTQTFSVELADFEDRLSTGCPVSSGGREVILSLRVPLAGVVTVAAEQPVAIGVRADDCLNDGGEFFCAEAQASLNLPAGLTFYWVLEEVEDTPSTLDVSVTYELEESCPDFYGESFCIDDDVVEVCTTTFSSPDAPRWIEAPCPEGCVNESCLGDRCESALLVSQSTFLQGETAGLTNSIVSDVTTGCTDYVNLPTPGKDFIIELDALGEAEEISFDFWHAHQEHGLLMIKEQCSSEAHCLHRFLGEGQHSFVAPADGNYFVIVSSMLESEAAFELTIEFEDEP